MSYRERSGLGLASWVVSFLLPQSSPPTAKIHFMEKE